MKMRTLFIFITTVIISQYVNCQVSNMTVKRMVDFSNYDFKTLKIISYVHDSTDCGEWGGHYEQILIYKDIFSGVLSYSYERQPNKCNDIIGYRGRRPQIHEQFKGVLTKEKQKYVSAYIKELFKFRFDFSGISNASNSYEVKFSNRCYSSGFEIEDEGDCWNKYKSFRDSIIKE